jgi:leader peptidase (prepilin peptidase) / N-methyltransferase
MIDTIFDFIFGLIESNIFSNTRADLNALLPILPPLVIYAFCFLISICVGSFINVVVHRLPLIFQQNLESFLDDLKNNTGEAPINMEDMPKSEANIEDDKEDDSSNLNASSTSSTSSTSTKNSAHISLSKPASTCPHCHQKIKWYDNIPILSWLILQAKCRYCKAAISSQYFWVELATGLLGVATAFIYLKSWPNQVADAGILLFLLLFIWQLIAITLLDAKTQLMPDELTKPLIISGLLFAAYQQLYQLNWQYAHNAADAILAGVLAFILLKGFASAFKKLRNIEGLGEGDIYLFAGFAVWFGFEVAAYALFTAAALGFAFIILAVIFKWRSFDQSIAFGPFLSLGLLIHLAQPGIF